MPPGTNQAPVVQTSYWHPLLRTPPIPSQIKSHVLGHPGIRTKDGPHVPNNTWAYMLLGVGDMRHDNLNDSNMITFLNSIG